MKRKLTGTVVMTAVALALSTALPLPDSLRWWLLPAVSAYAGAAAGAFIARERFVAVALTIQFALWLLMVYLLYAIAGGQTAYSQIALGNLNVLAISLIAAATGSLLGQHLAIRRAVGAAGA